MAEDQKQGKKSNKKRMDISAVAFADNLVFSKKECWAYYKVQNYGYDFLSNYGKASLGQKITNAFSNILMDKTESLECHLINTSVPIDVPLWRDQIESISEEWNHAPGFRQYMDLMSSFLRNEEYHKKVCYIGINLGKRGALDMADLNPFEAGLKASWEALKEWGSKALAIPTEAVSESEEDYYRGKEESLFRAISTGNLKGERATAEELLLLIKRQLYPAMPAPDLDVDHDERLGAGDLAIETTGAIENNYRWLKIVQMIGDEELEGYRATLSLTKFPKEMQMPGLMPYFYVIQQMGLPFTTFARFTLHPTQKMKAELEKKKKEQRDELKNISEGMDGLDSAVSGGLPDEAAEALQDQQHMSAILASDKSPWVEGSYFIVVETPTEKVLRDFVARLRQVYTDMEINIAWSAGDQAQLFLSQMPGDTHRMKSFDQTTTLSMIAASGFNFSGEVGDDLYSEVG